MQITYNYSKENNFWYRLSEKLKNNININTGTQEIKEFDISGGYDEKIILENEFWIYVNDIEAYKFYSKYYAKIIVFGIICGLSSPYEEIKIVSNSIDRYKFIFITQ